jgi:hypothetical protein
MGLFKQAEGTLQVELPKKHAGTGNRMMNRISLSFPIKGDPRFSHKDSLLQDIDFLREIVKMGMENVVVTTKKEKTAFNLVKGLDTSKLTMLIAILNKRL